MHSRREFILSALGLGLTTSLSTAATSGKKAHLCPPRISGPLWAYDPAQTAAWGVSGWRDELDLERAIGFDLLWLVGAPDAFLTERGPADLRALLDLCSKRKVRVILDTGSSGVWWSPLDIERELELCGSNIEKMGQHFRGHPAFAMWYVPHEIAMNWDGESGAYINRLYPELVARCKKAADLPVTLSPFFLLDRDKVFGDFRYAEPEEYHGHWAKLIKLSGFDIIMLQDSGEHFSYVTNEMRKPFFEAMSAACRDAGARFWANVETAEFECPSKEEYVRRYGRVHHSTVKDAPWRAVPLGRLEEKLNLAAHYSEEIVCWGYREYGRPALSEAARKWYEEYRAYYRRVRSSPSGLTLR